MAFKKRRMMLIPQVNPEAFVFFFEKGNSGMSWSIRDYSVRNRVKEYGPRDFLWSADEIHEKAIHSVDAPTVPTGNLPFWHSHTAECNERYLRSKAAGLARRSESDSTKDQSLRQQPAFPVLNEAELEASPKGCKTKDIERIRFSPNSEDWVTWNFFHILLHHYPTRWWGHLVSCARRRNSSLSLQFDELVLPRTIFWSSISSPPEYEWFIRQRMKHSNVSRYKMRAESPEPVEGKSEIDVVLDHSNFSSTSRQSLAPTFPLALNTIPRASKSFGALTACLRTLETVFQSSGCW